MTNTNRNTVKLLCNSIITRLENRKAIELTASVRDTVRDALYDLLGQHIMTDEDLRNQTLEKIGAASNQLIDSEITESSQYRTARSLVRKSFGDDELNGLYFKKTLKELAEMAVGFMMSSTQIDEVFESDDELGKMIVDIVKKFKAENVH